MFFPWWAVAILVAIFFIAFAQIFELGRRVHALTGRVDDLEARELREIMGPPPEPQED
jgi:hypothetical protein